MRWLTTALMTLLVPITVLGAPILRTKDIRPEATLPPETFQAVVFLDGAEALSTNISFEMVDFDGSVHWLRLAGIQSWERVISTIEFDLNGSVPTGLYKIENVYSNGEPDGIAMAILYKNVNGNIYIGRTSGNQTTSTFVGYRPLAVSEEYFQTVTPQITTEAGKLHAHSLIHGAQILPNGTYSVFSPVEGN